jgi:hypothetical protein
MLDRFDTLTFANRGDPKTAKNGMGCDRGVSLPISTAEHLKIIDSEKLRLSVNRSEERRTPSAPLVENSKKKKREIAISSANLPFLKAFSRKKPTNG